MADWYPQRLSERDSWHAGFDAQATATGTTFGLSAGDKAEIHVDSILVSLCADYDVVLRQYVEAWTEWRNLVLDGDPNAAFPNPPTQPSFVLPDENFKPGVQPRTRSKAGIIKADADYTPAVGEDYGIVSPAAPPAGVPSLVATALTASQVRLGVTKAGYSVVAIDSKRGGGAWEQIGVSMTAEYIDARAPLVAGQPEQREYRAQGMESNARVGALSAVVSAVTVP